MADAYEVCEGFKIYTDEDAANPRTEFDNVGTMVCWHRGYNLGDEQPSCRVLVS